MCINYVCTERSKKYCDVTNKISTLRDVLVGTLRRLHQQLGRLTWFTPSTSGLETNWSLRVGSELAHQKGTRRFSACARNICTCCCFNCCNLSLNCRSSAAACGHIISGRGMAAPPVRNSFVYSSIPPVTHPYQSVPGCASCAQFIRLFIDSTRRTWLTASSAILAS
eukprot:9156959-Pyramimonas_sp.AAC.1